MTDKTLDLVLDYLNANESKVFNQYDLDRDEDGNSNGARPGPVHAAKPTVPLLFGKYDKNPPVQEKDPDDDLNEYD